jgi:starch-binding outer membrane protein, SusD/RagB family
MKKIQFLYSLALSGLFVLSSCGDRLEVLPTQTIDEKIALSTQKDVEAFLKGTYDGLQGTNTSGDTYAGGFQYTSELLGDAGEIRFGGTFANLLELWNKAVPTNNLTAETQWIRAYVTINRCNNVLGALSIVADADRPRVEGEASFIRGALYFELARLYGKQWGDGDNAVNLAVPLVLTATRSVTDKDQVARNTVAQVYAQAIADLTKAEASLPAANSFYATKGAAAALLARLYLQQGDYTAAAAAANRVIANTKYALVTPFGAAFNTKLNNGGANPAEYVFAVQASDQDGFNGMNTFFGTTIASIPGTAGRGDMRILPAHIALYDTLLDTRSKFFIKPSASSTNLFTYKFLDRFGNVPVVRLAEMYLTRAEANFRQSTAVGATPLADINRTRKRAGLPDLLTVTLADILKERRLELAFEGFRLHDAKRLKQSVGTLPWNDNKLVLPIPQREMDVNKSLVQNAGY